MLNEIHAPDIESIKAEDGWGARRAALDSGNVGRRICTKFELTRETDAD
jgi:hypothetical protein